jgi:type I restriction enzyme, R subunit
VQSSFCDANSPFEPTTIYANILNLYCPGKSNLFENNHAFYKMLTDGVDVEFFVDDRLKHDKVWAIDFLNPNNNDWLVVNQFTVVENANRRPDKVVFINGIPIALIELKNVVDEKTLLALLLVPFVLPTLLFFSHLLLYWNPI